MTGPDNEGLRCPSAQPSMADPQVLGVASGEASGARIAYLNQFVAATPELLAQAAPARPDDVFRLAARCEQSKCTHFDGDRCQLAARIVAMLPEVTEHLPPCAIRPSCRWFEQEARAACLRCPQIVTHVAQANDFQQVVAGGT